MSLTNTQCLICSPLGVFSSLHFFCPLKIKIANTTTCDYASSKSEAQY